MAFRNQRDFVRKLRDALLISNDSANGISSFESDKQRLETNEACDSGDLKGCVSQKSCEFLTFLS